MEWRMTFYAYALVFSAALSTVVFAILWVRRTKSGARPLALLMLAAAEWAIAIAFETTSIHLGGKIFWSQVSYLGIVCIAPLFFQFSYEYTTNKRKPSTSLMVSVWIIPVLTFLLTATNNMHHLVWSSYEFAPDSTIVIYHHGIAFWGHIVYLYLLLMISCGSLVWSAIRTRNLYRKHAITILTAVPIPLIWNVLYILNDSPLPWVDLTPIFFSISGLILTWGIYRIGLFEIVPVERSLVLENLSDGVIILDIQDRIVDINRAGADFIQAPEIKVIGEDIGKICPWFSENYKNSKPGEETIFEFEISRIPIQFLEARVCQIKVQNSRIDGTSILLRDVTNARLAQLALEESEKRYRSLMESASFPIVLLTPDQFIVLFANDRLNDLLEEPGISFEGASIEKYFDRHGELQRLLRMTKKNGIVNDVEAPITTGGGKQLWVLISANMIQYEKQDVLFLFFNDITARKIIEETERQQRIFSEALQNSVSALNSTLNFDEVLDRILVSLEKVIPHDIANIMLVDEAGSARVVRAHGYEVAGLEKLLSKVNLQVAETPNLLKMAVSGQPLVIPDTHHEPSWLMLEGTEWVRSYIGAPILIKGKIAGYINLDSTRVGMFDQTHADRLQIFADQAAIAIENARMFEKVEQMAIVDMLTGLYNRRHFFELAEREVERFRRYHSPLSLILMDLDHFKKVNDRYGHLAGDAVLQELAVIFNESLRKMDIPGRLGGEEFVILLPETHLDQAVLAADRIRQTIDKRDFIFESHHIHMTATMGVTEMKDEFPNFQMLISLTDKMMYEGKQAGRNRIRSLEA